MTRWKFWSILAVALAVGVVGCGSSASSTVTLVISPTAASVITNTTQQFSPLVTGSSNTTVTWTVTCPTVSNVTVTGCGTIDTNGLYTAPATIPTATISGTVTPEPTATITATAAADTTKVETATVTIITGISIAINPFSATVGTSEHFTFTATVTNPGCNTTVNTTCLNVTWSLPSGVTGDGTIDVNGVYTAPSTAPSPSTVVITATSVTDTSITATATVNIVTATDPTVASVSPNTAALGSLFQDVYITGTNFISTSIVYVNGTLVDPTEVTDDSSSGIRARILPNLLASIPASGVLSFSVSQQVGAPQTCTDAALCQVVIAPVRPAIVGPSPDSIPQIQNSASVQSFNVNGGFFGTMTNPSVTATYDGKQRVAAVTSNTARQLSITIGGSTNSQDFSLAGLHQVRIQSNGDITKFASTNLAVQPDANANPPTLVGTVAAGGKPSDVAVDPSTGMAVIANSGTNDVTLVDLTATTPAVILPSLCTGALGAATAPNCVSSGPQSVAVAHLVNPAKDIALVANSAAMTVSEIDLNSKSVIWVSPTLQNSPIAVGINPVTGRALVAMSFAPYGLLLDLTQTPPAILGPVTISTGTKAHIAIEPHLNWALATPGGAGSISIVDLNRQTTNNITAVSRTTNVVTVTVQAATSAIAQSPLSVVDGDSVQIQGISDNTFNGIYQISAVGPGPSQFSYTLTGSALPDVASEAATGIVNYAQPVATLDLTLSVQGIAINPETQTAILADPSSSGGVSVFSLIDQSVLSLQLANTNSTAEPGAAAAAFNQLTNTAYLVNTNNSTLSVIDPTKPQRLPTPTSTFGNGLATPVGIAVDPATNRLIVANQANNTAAVYTLGSSSTIRPIAITESNPKVFVANSTLTTAAAPSALTLTILGTGFSANSVARLDGAPLSTSFVSNRSLTAIVPPSLLSTARRFDLDVLDSGSNLSNASDFTVEQSIDVTGCSTAPLPSGVAVDPQQNIAAVTLLGCNSLALISLANGTGQTVAVGTNPFGVAVIPNLHEAVVANNGSQNASIVDELGASVLNTVATDSGSQGVSADQDTGEAAVANSVANDVTVLNVGTAGTNSLTTDQTPIATAFNYQNHQVATATSGSNTVDTADGAASATAQSFSVAGPTSVIYDPVTGNLGSDCGSTTNLVGCFLVNSSQGNNLTVIDPVSNYQSSFRIGINPTAIAYNYLTSTVVSTNTLSHTVTVGDFLDRRIRAVLTLPAAPQNSTLALNGNLQFALDIHPLRNLAVIADTANGRVLFVPIPR